MQPAKKDSPAAVPQTVLNAVATGFLIRAAWILLLHTYRFRVTEDHFAFGYETGRIARALALGQGFSNPFHGITGPTAWEAPVYPYLLALVFKLTGVYTPLSAILILAANSLLSALTALPVYLAAKKLFGPRTAKWSAWAWALLPYTMYWAARWVWETSLTTFLLTTAFWLTLELADATGKRALRLWLWFGFLWGVIALTNPTCLTFLPFAGAWACRRLARRKERWLLPAISSALVFGAVITPWEVRNFVVFRAVVPIRSNAGAELRLGNSADASGIWMAWLHPTQDVLQMRAYEQMGEIAYSGMRGREALDFMRRQPGLAAALLLEKFIYYWAGVPRSFEMWWQAVVKDPVFPASAILAWWGLGLMLLRRVRGAAVFAMLLFVYPLSFYVVYPHARYRHPIEPVMLILIVYLLSQTRELRGGEAAPATEDHPYT
jgi:4-amino-4-deoxy-L-arabinose transferase-like glycosyltransferase